MTPLPDPRGTWGYFSAFSSVETVDAQFSGL